MDNTRCILLVKNIFIFQAAGKNVIKINKLFLLGFSFLFLIFSFLFVNDSALFINYNNIYLPIT